MNTNDYLTIYQDHKANGDMPTGANLRALEQLAGLKPSQPYNCGKISSHANWYRGKWTTDTCACGHKFRVPAGDKGRYRCDCCANRDY